MTWRQRCFVSLDKYSYWSRFHVNIITRCGVMTISFYKGLTRNPEIGNNPIRVWLNIWRLLQASNTKFGANVSNKMLLNDAKCQGYSFYRFWAIKEKPTGRGGGGGTNPHAPQIKVKCWRGVILNSRVPCKLHIKLKGCYILKSKDSAVFTWLLKKVLFKTFIQNLVINNEG